MGPIRESHSGRKPGNDGKALPEGYRLDFVQHVRGKCDKQTRLGLHREAAMLPFRAAEEAIEFQGTAAVTIR